MADRQTTLDNVRKQVEFYFSDSNYPKDKFLRSQAAQNDQGWVPLSIIATFSRMKKITEDLALVKEALKSATTIAVSADGESVRRLAPLPEQDTSLNRTIYAKGFPSETGYTIEDVEKVFSKFGKILSVRIRKMKNDKQLKPSVFVEYSTTEEADAATATASQFDGKDLLVMKKSVYNDGKKQLRKEKSEEAKSKRKADDPDTSNNNNEKKQKREHKKDDEEKKETRISGAIVKLAGLGAETTKDLLKDIFGAYGEVVYVDLHQIKEEKTKDAGFVRMASSEVAQKAVEEFTKDPKDVGGKTPTVSVMEAEEERKYWDNVHQNKFSRSNTRKNKNRRKRF